MPLYMTWEQIEQVRLRYLCSDCWEPVNSKKVGDDLYEIRCDTQGCTTPALVSMSSVTWRTQKKLEEQIIFSRSIRDAARWLNPDKEKKTPEELLKLLGF